MIEVAPPVAKDAIIAELTADKFLRKTNKGDNEIYVVTAHNSPNIMAEIGRLRELTFRVAGGGTGDAVDIDRYDTIEHPYQQLFVWDPDAREILGGYRYLLGKGLGTDDNGDLQMATAQLFVLSDRFKQEYLPYTIELGRSFVQPDYQSSKAGAKALFALDNLWDGLGALTVDYPDMKYFFGKVTMYTHFNIHARNMILYFFQKYFGDNERLVYPKNPIALNMDEAELERRLNGGSFQADYRLLTQGVRELGENVPPLINAYMNLSPSMKTFGTAINPHFGGVEETGISVTIKDIYEAKKDRHIETYMRQKTNLYFELK
ncbi:MAG: GNAT family N-acetyltransferase [Bacteroidales bacterium]|jgi:hypothetical protein|nr:GNAT family N-acetyltransferase [Bacteroidales bacterium]